MNRYIDDNMHTPELEQSLSQSKVLPMVKDLSYKYDLRVSQRLLLEKVKAYLEKASFRFIETENYDKFNDVRYNYNLEEGKAISLVEAFVLDYQGIPQALVYVDYEDNFCFQASYDIKDRGKDEWDRYTITSNKVSQVLKTLKRKRWSPLSNGDTYKVMEINTTDMVMDYSVDGISLKKSISDYDSAIRNLTYDHSNKLSEVLDSLYGTKSSIPHATNEHYVKEFKSCDGMHDRVKSIFKEIKPELDNRFTAIGITNSGGWIVGEAYEHTDGDFKLPSGEAIHYTENRISKKLKSKFDIEFGDLVIHKTHRVRDLEQLDFFDSLKPTLTMLKVKLQDWEDKEDRNEVVRDYFKKTNYNHSWIEELGCYYIETQVWNSANHNPFGITWLLMAKLK
jgi:hypothetical protein